MHTPQSRVDTFISYTLNGQWQKYCESSARENGSDITDNNERLFFQFLATFMRSLFVTAVPARSTSIR